jgi:LacI family transcriptional regulator
VPGDISVAGYDDYRVIAETSATRTLTSVELAYAAMGAFAPRERLLRSDFAGDQPGDPPNP